MFSYAGIDEFILFSINWEIKGVPLNASATSAPNVLVPISHIAMASSVDFHASKLLVVEINLCWCYYFLHKLKYFTFAEEDYIYWADSDHGTITRVKRDGSQREVIVGLPNHDSTQTDWLAGN